MDEGGVVRARAVAAEFKLFGRILLYNTGKLDFHRKNMP